MDDKLLKLRSVLKTMPLNDNQINNILGIIDTQNKEIYDIIDTQNKEINDTIAPLLEQYYSYGIEKDYTNSSPNCIRIGNLDLHRSLPIQSKMRGCLLDDDGNVVEYLPENDWTTATRDGSKGQVMVHIPHHYRRFYTKNNNNIICTRISELPLKGYHYVPDMFVSAYEASIEHSSRKLCSVVNYNSDYRGGSNNSDWDETYRSLLGRPVSEMNRSEFRSAARKRNASNTSWNCYLYHVHKALFWLYTIEYANLDSQSDYNSELTSDGFHQGGLGTGISDIDISILNQFNDNNPFVPCGHTDTLGNSTGVVAYTVYNENGLELKTLNVPRYRGIENLFGHIIKSTDGVNILISPTEDNGGDNLSKVFICEDPSKLNDNNYDGYKYVGNEARINGYVKEIIFGEEGEIIPSLVGDTSTQYFCDYHSTYIPTTKVLRNVLFGGAANSSNTANGLLNIITSSTPMFKSTYIGSRLCFIPQQNKN